MKDRGPKLYVASRRGWIAAGENNSEGRQGMCTTYPLSVRHFPALGHKLERQKKRNKTTEHDVSVVTQDQKRLCTWLLSVLGDQSHGEWDWESGDDFHVSYPCSTEVYTTISSTFSLSVIKIAWNQLNSGLSPMELTVEVLRHFEVRTRACIGASPIGTGKRKRQCKISSGT